MPNLKLIAATIALSVIALSAGLAAPDRYTAPQHNRSEITAIIDTTYGEKLDQGGRRTELLVDLFLPPGATSEDPRPLVIVIHGGGFRNGTKERNRDWAIEYATCGYVAACINYRLTPHEMRDRSPGNFVVAATHAVEDGMDAIRFLKQNASQYGIDRDRIATLGMSAGGWISVINGLEYDTFNGARNYYPSESSKVQAAIATGVSLADGAIHKHIRDALIAYDERDTPILLFHAETADRVTTAPWSEAEILAKRINDSGNTAELYPQPGDRHVDDMSPSGPYWDRIAAFLQLRLSL